MPNLLGSNSRKPGIVDLRRWPSRSERSYAGAAIRELQALDDHLLKDIGISRSQIPYIVEEQLSGTSKADVHYGEAAPGQDRRVDETPPLPRAA